MLDDQQADRAKRHIEDIRKDFDVGNFGSSRHVKNLERALDLLSDQLYQKPTHFLLELIQNADDNEYDTPVPTLTFTYENRHLRIDCNERGFSQANVEAICRIGQSTKAPGARQATRYVGEKGIGFKSVFKIADKVWIASNGYGFKFDKTQPLGMIAPIWDDFPQKTDPKLTSILLELSPSYKETILLKELRRLDARILIFLRRLRQIDVHIHLPEEPEWQTSLIQVEGVACGQYDVILSHDSDKYRYKVLRFDTPPMPSEARRMGITKSEVLLAFPEMDEHQENLESQQVYAFLPIRDYGFKFLIQGDFLLSASREDVLPDSAWNQALRDCFVDSFVKIVEKRNRNPFKYHWPRFIPPKPINSTFFENARMSIIRALETRVIVQNRLLHYVRPSQVLQVPKEFRDRNGQPILAIGCIEKQFLSDSYDETCHESLQALRVRKMDLKDFVRILKQLLAQETAKFRAQPNEWHSDLARCILSALWQTPLVSDKYSWSTIRELQIVPLENGSWACASEQGVFLPPDSHESVEFGDLDTKLVRKDAVEDSSQNALYKHLEIPSVNQSQLCDHIVTSRLGCYELIREMKVSQIVSQTIYLFKSGWTNVKCEDLWFKTQSSTFNQGSKLYIPSSSKYSASTYFGPVRMKERFLHDQYFEMATTSGINLDVFKAWLMERLHLWELPRLLDVWPQTVGSSQQPSTYKVHADFMQAVVYKNYSEWIYLIRDNFSAYSVFFDLEKLMAHKLYGPKLGPRNATAVSAHKNFLKSMSMLHVMCSDGKTEQLQETYLPSPSLKMNGNSFVPTVNVSDPEHPDWQYFKRFGLGVEPDLLFYLRFLERLSSLPSGLKTNEQVTHCLDQIQARHMEDTELVTKCFKTKTLIRVPPVNVGSDYRWIKPEVCLWDGPACMRRHPVLRQLYPGNATLFVKCLGIPNATIRELCKEIREINQGDDLEYIKDLFFDVEKMLRRSDAYSDTYVYSARYFSIFPVTATGVREQPALGYESLKQVTAQVDWFIADRLRLRHSFIDKLPLLAFSVQRVLQLKNVMEKGRLDRHRLSRRAESRADTNGSSTFHPGLTKDLLQRVVFILRLIPPSVSMRSKRRIATQLRSLQVFLADHLVQEWSVKLDSGTTVQGRPYRSNVVFAMGQNRSLCIYLARQYFASSVCKTEVTEQFADFCEIGDLLHLLNTALWESHAEVEAIYENYGVPEYDPMIDSNSPLNEDDDSETEQNETGVQNGDKGKAPVRPQAASTAASASSGQQTGKQKLTHSTGNVHDNRAPANVVCSRCSQAISDSGLVANDRNHRRFSGLLRILGRPRKVEPASFLEQQVNIGSPELHFKGEEYVSSILSRSLGEKFTPAKHWTSPLRTRAGHLPFNGSSATHASFTIPDTTGAVTKFLLRGHPDLSNMWTRTPPTWHLEVKTTAGILEDPFYMTNQQLDRARSYASTNFHESTKEIPANVVMLIRVYRVNGPDGPKAVFYRDPWEMFLQNDVSIRTDTLYKCSVDPEQPRGHSHGQIEDGEKERIDPERHDLSLGSGSGSKEKEAFGTSSIAGRANGDMVEFEPPPPYRFGGGGGGGTNSIRNDGDDSDIDGGDHDHDPDRDDLTG